MRRSESAPPERPRYTAVKSMPRPKTKSEPESDESDEDDVKEEDISDEDFHDDLRDTKEENEDTDSDDEEELYTSCLGGEVRTKGLTMPYTAHWAADNYQEDLYILEDSDFWDGLSEDHKIAATTASFSFVRDADDYITDLSVLSSLPSVNTALYLDETWYYSASAEQVWEDIKDKPQHVQKRVLNTTARAKATPKRKPAARREASAQEKRQYAKQFHQAKLDEYKSWSKENDIFELVDLRKHKVQNYITGRWVLTIKRDKNGEF